MAKSLAISMKAKNQANNIFKLNEDCLAEVLRYLPLQDVKTTIAADKRFRSPACIRFAYGGIDLIDPDFIQKYPKEMRDDFVEAFGKKATMMKFKLLNVVDFLTMIPHFRNLKELILSEIRMDAHESAFPAGLQSLELDRCEINQKAIRSWFKQLNATLTHLRIIDWSKDPENSPILAIDELSNIQSLLIDGLPESCFQVVGKFLDLNKNSLLCLTLIKQGSSQKLSFGQDILKLQRLKELHLNCFYFEETGSNLFPALTTLHVPGYGSAFILNLACGESLHTLIIDDYSRLTVPMSNLARFKSLRRLELLQVEWDGAATSDLALFVQFPQLQTLVLNSGVFDTAEDVLGIPRSMPALRQLSLEWILIFNDRRMDAETLEKRLKGRFKKSFPKLKVELSIVEE